MGIYISRREIFFPVLFLPISIMSCSAARSHKLTDMGAVGDGMTNDTVAIMKALRSGRPMDGEGKTFAIIGNILVDGGFAGLTNATFVHKVDSASDGQALIIKNSQGFAIQNLSVRQSGDNHPPSTRSMMDRSAFFIQNCSDFTLEQVSVSGGGCGTGLTLHGCHDFETTDILVEQRQTSAAIMPPDDVLQGFWIQLSHGFRVIRPKVRSIGVRVKGEFLADQSRGLVIGGSSHFEIVDLDVSAVGQGLDITGGDGNHDFKVLRGHARDCGTWGFKFANTARNGTITDAIAERCGLGGFVASGPVEKISTPPTQSLTFQRCRAENIVGSWRKAGTFGFGIMNDPTITPGYPRSIRFEKCIAKGGSGKKMMVGFRNDLPALDKATRNLAIDCSASDYSEHAFIGFSVN